MLLLISIKCRWCGFFCLGGGDLTRCCISAAHLSVLWSPSPSSLSSRPPSLAPITWWTRWVCRAPWSRPAPAHSRHRLDQAPLLVLRRTPCAVNAAAGCSHRSAREPTRPRTTRFASDVRPYRTHSRVGWAPIWPRKIKRRRPASDRKSRMTSPRRLLPSSLPNSDLVLSAVVVTHRPQLRL
ncbi:hypothetical protein BHM03_00061251 [Ensete ventricosum]|nr:hypothetical protein BHM03_00061251 [Ensete ventricosum]